MTDVNPFQFGALALDEAFTDREAEIAELRADVRNGQDVVVFAPRRYGKSSLVWRATQELARDRVLVASVDLMTTPTPAKLAEKLARAIHDDIASPLLRARERLRIFGDLKVTPTITVDPESGAPAFSFSVTERPEDIDATIERLLELPGAARRRPQAPGRARARRVPGGRRHRPEAAAADARGVPARSPRSATSTSAPSAT